MLCIQVSECRKTTTTVRHSLVSVPRGFRSTHVAQSKNVSAGLYQLANTLLDTVLVEPEVVM